MIHLYTYNSPSKIKYAWIGKSDGSQEDLMPNDSSHRVILLRNHQAFCGIRCFNLDAHLFGQHRITYFGQAKLHGVNCLGKKSGGDFPGSMYGERKQRVLGPRNGSFFGREFPLLLGKSKLLKYDNLARYILMLNLWGVIWFVRIQVCDGIISIAKKNQTLDIK